VVVNNTFINNNHFNRVNVANGNVWQHNSVHRAGVPYADRNVANRYNAGGINQINHPGVNQTQQRLDRAVGQGNAGQRGQGVAAQQSPGAAQHKPGAGQNASRPPQPPNSGAGDRIGNRQVGGGNVGGGRSAFSDMNQGGGRAQMNSSRGAASARGFSGGGRRR
jgi:hypothetical protein